MSSLKDTIKNLNKNNFQIIKRLGIDPKYKYVTVRIGAEESDNFVSVKCYSFKLYEGNFKWEWVLGEKVLTFKIVDHKKDMYDLSIPLLSNTMGRFSIDKSDRNLRTKSIRKVVYTLQNLKCWRMENDNYRRI